MALVSLWAAFGLAPASCNARNVVVDIPVSAYVPAACGDAGGAQVTFTGLGDFSQASPAAQTGTLGISGVPLSALPADTREIVMTPVADASPWTGAALVPDAGAVSILTLPQGQACPLSAQVDLAGDLGVAVGMIDGSHALFVGGPNPASVVDLGTGAISQLASPLMPQRNYATVTPFGGGALIAGGEDPMAGEQSTAVVYTPARNGAVGTFGAPINLPGGQTREKHGAVQLADGRVLLVGGISGTALPLDTIDVLDPTGPSDASVLSVTLRTPRVSPTVLALPNGEVFVGGGFDADQNPIKSVEWLDASLASIVEQPLCGVDAEQGFVPTEGGAVLAVMGPTPGSTTCSNVHLLLPTGVEEAPILSPPPRLVRLFPGSQASPVLITDQSTLRWNPWTTLFATLGASASGLNLPTTAFLTASPGLALWLGGDNSVWTLRFDTHGPYATDYAHGPYLVTDDEFTTPDRLPGADVSFSVGAGGFMNNGATIWITDATFAGVTASVTLPSGGAVAIVLRNPSGAEVVCSATGAPSEASVQVVRQGATVTATLNGVASPPCSGTFDSPTARVAVGVRSVTGQGASTVRSLSVVRGT